MRRSSCKCHISHPATPSFILNYSKYFLLFNTQDIDFYSTKIQDCIQSAKQPLIIFIDSLECADNLNDLNWLPTQLPDNVKIILTISSEASTVDKLENGDDLLKILKGKLNVSQFVHLNQFSADQWKDVLLFGGGDFYAANGALHLPEDWQSSSEKIPLQAKVRSKTDGRNIFAHWICAHRFSGGWHGLVNSIWKT